MMRWVANLSGLPTWHDWHSGARLAMFAVGYMPFFRLSSYDVVFIVCDSIHFSAPPWQDSQPMPSATLNSLPRTFSGTLSAWQSRQIFASYAFGRPSFAAM